MPRGKGHPTMVSGARAGELPKREGEDGETVVLPKLRKKGDRPDRGTIRHFESESPSLRLQLATTPKRITAEGYVEPGESLAVQFEMGALTLDSAIPEQARKIKLLEKSPYYGIGKQFWDADEFTAVAEEKALDHFANRILDNPELLERLEGKLKVKNASAKDFETGAGAGAQQPVV